MLWKKYNPREDSAIDDWIQEKYSINFEIVNRFALYKEKLSTQYRWYLANHGNMSNIKDQIIVFRESHEIIGFFILNYSLIGEIYQLGINPICVNPNLLFMGYGVKMTNVLINQCELMIDGKVDVITANISINNRACVRMLEKCGFKRGKMNEDKDFIEYYFSLENK